MANGNNFLVVVSVSTWRCWEREFNAKLGGRIVGAGEPTCLACSTAFFITHRHRIGALAKGFDLHVKKAQ